MAMTADGRLYHILVRDLLLKCLIGIHEYERLAPQRVRINVDMAVFERAGPLGDDIANVVSYEDIINGIKRVMDDGHINLVETLAEDIAALCLVDSRVDSVRVRVEKLDVYAEAASVGVEIERRRG
jgi:7,8-dihydroneopterin aldolase/epimerase/oxygenase